MKWSPSRTVLAAAVAVVAFAGAVHVGFDIAPSSANAASPAVAATNATASPAVVAPSARVALPDFSALVEQVGPAVVNISVTSVDRSARGGIQIDENDPMYEFFRRFGIPVPGAPGGPNAAPRVQQGVGSGFIVSADGYILTNAHVVDGATEVTVRLTDKREFKAKVIGLDKRTDVALVKIEAGGLPVLKTGDTEKTKVGEWVLAVGSPFGFENTVTAGIVSAKARRLPDENFVPFIQTDVAINPGNSGGPLFNLSGEVIGINSQIYSRSGGFMGISFAIPIDVALKVKDQLQQHGKVQRGKLGVGFQPLDKDLAEALGLDKPQGALVREVESGGPADKAGVQQGDVIQQVDGTRVEDAGDLPRAIGERRPGDTVKLRIWRDKKARDVSVKLAEMPSDVASADEPEQGKEAPAGKLGLSVRPLTGNESQRLNVPGGLLVEQTTGASQRAGIRQGDIVLAVGNTSVNTIDQLRKAVDAAGNRVPLLVQRGSSRQYVVVRAG
ncbi:DegQ family serine endoprotease [Uliginosibacterium sp. H1]|uniref:DegQ family serine endoprotease n=1 Tax=Uliginosibacterium sp. H1 TaxID=3114757 RepID=UPI002E1764D5|nr:DegQ family serine endoprotease [Uliginosibacterium sp. H1]